MFTAIFPIIRITNIHQTQRYFPHFSSMIFIISTAFFSWSRPWCQSLPPLFLHFKGHGVHYCHLDRLLPIEQDPLPPQLPAPVRIVHFLWGSKLLTNQAEIGKIIRCLAALPVEHIICVRPVEFAATGQAVVQLDQRRRPGEKKTTRTRIRTETSRMINATRLQHQRISEFLSRPLSCSWEDGRQPRRKSLYS